MERFENEKKKKKKRHDIIKRSTQRMDTSSDAKIIAGKSFYRSRRPPLKTVKLACESYRKWPRWDEKPEQGKHSFSRPVVFE